ncbi:hypothetical protein KR032_005716 [Drosophila birchii]|nr:hypothetical protein KR032_005716 [Drosophila birchii]
MNAIDANDTLRGVEDRAGPSNVVNTNDTLLGLEDLAHGTNDQGMPFIMVDSAECTSRSDLELALSRVEQKRMQQVLDDIDSRDLPQLHDTGPPPELDMKINLGQKALAERIAAEEEQRFCRDISELTFWTPEEDKACTSIRTTTSPNTNTTIDQVILKLDQLRSLAKQVQPRNTETPTAKLPERPGLHRQGTFDIKRKNEGDKDSGPDIANAGAASSKKPQAQKAPYRGGIPSLRKKEFPEKKFHSVKARQLMNHIADSFTELSALYEEEHNGVMSEGSVYCYMVTIRVVGGTPNCSIEPLSETEFNQLCVSQNQSSETIYHPKRSKSEINSCVIGRNFSRATPFKQDTPYTYSEERGRPKAFHKTPCSLVNNPSPAKYYPGRKRD